MPNPDINYGLKISFVLARQEVGIVGRAERNIWPVTLENKEDMSYNLPGSFNITPFVYHTILVPGF